jgi:signal transduction histidine kinase
MKLRTRLSLFFLGTVALLLAGFSATLYALAAKYLHRQVDERLEAALNTLVAAAEVDAHGVEWEPNERRLAFGRRIVEGQFFWLVRDEVGKRIDGSQPDSGPLSPTLTASPVTGSRARSFIDSQGRPWRTMIRRLEPLPVAKDAPRSAPDDPEAVGAQKHKFLLIETAVSLSGVRESLANLGAVLVTLSAGTWLLALFLGGRLSQRALRPVAAMAEVAHSIGADEIDRRLPQPHSRDELEDLGRAFNGLLDRLHEAHERERRFTDDASHQLRTPLTAMQGQIDLALRQERSADEYRKALSLVQRKTRHLRQIVEGLLFLARASAEAERPALELLDLADWLPGHLAARAEGSSASNVKPRVEPDGAYRVRAQPTLLGELLDNLLDNASKYADAGQPIYVRLGRGEHGVALSVEDRGPGIAEHEIPRLFEPFYRTDAARKRGQAGVGLGLAVASRLADLFGATIRVTSTPGVGSVFTVDFPDADRNPVPAAAKPEGTVRAAPIL